MKDFERDLSSKLQIMNSQKNSFLENMNLKTNNIFNSIKKLLQENKNLKQSLYISEINRKSLARKYAEQLGVLMSRNQFERTLK